MGEALMQPHVSYLSDRMVDSWDALLPPVEVPPPPLKETFRETKKATAKKSQTVVEIIPRADLRYCHWCNKPFQPGRRNQRFCDPDRERKLNWERRKALVVALAEHLKALGNKWVDMLALAQRCVDAYYDWIFGAMQKLGWTYGLKTKAWKLTMNGNGSGHPVEEQP